MAKDTGKALLPSFDKFIRDLRATWADLPNDESRMRRAHELMENNLLTDEALSKHAEDWPSTEGRKNLLFYEDPDYGFVINGFNTHHHALWR